jgi:hypothetical protein
MRRIAVLAAALTALAVLPGRALANHHACPQVTITQGDVNVARKDCSPVYVPYPVGGPKSPLPPGANIVLPPVVAGCQSQGIGNGGITCPAGSLVYIPTITTPYPPFAPLPGQGSPSDPLGCYGPDLSFVQKLYLTPILGQPRGSDPADPYNCSGGWIMPVKLGSALLGLAAL